MEQEQVIISKSRYDEIVALENKLKDGGQFVKVDVEVKKELIPTSYRYTDVDAGIFGYMYKDTNIIVVGAGEIDKFVLDANEKMSKSFDLLKDAYKSLAKSNNSLQQMFDEQQRELDKLKEERANKKWYQR